MNGRSWAGMRPLTGQWLSDFGLLGHLERVIYLCSTAPDEHRRNQALP